MRSGRTPSVEAVARRLLMVSSISNFGRSATSRSIPNAPIMAPSGGTERSLDDHELHGKCPSRRDLAVDATPQTERIGILQAVRQERLRHVLVADGPEEAGDCEGADRGRTAVGGRREGAAMHYGVADLDARAEAVHQDAADLGLEQRQEGAGHLVIRWLHVERCGKL